MRTCCTYLHHGPPKGDQTQLVWPYKQAHRTHKYINLIAHTTHDMRITSMAPSPAPAHGSSWGMHAAAITLTCMEGAAQVA